MMMTLMLFVFVQVLCVCLCQSVSPDMWVRVLHTCTHVPMVLLGITHAQHHYWLDPGHGAARPHLCRATRFSISPMCCISFHLFPAKKQLGSPPFESPLSQAAQSQMSHFGCHECNSVHHFYKRCWSIQIQTTCAITGLMFIQSSCFKIVCIIRRGWFKE